MTDAPLLVAVDDGIARLTLNRPKAGNAIDQAMADALVEAAVRVANDAAIRVVLLTGTGRLFCAGGDIGAFTAPGSDTASVLTKLAGTLHQALTLLAGMEKPFVVAVNGPAAGAGLSLTLAGDITLASDTAHFTAAYGAIGLTPDGGMSWRLPRAVGLRRAQEILLTNRRIGAAEAEALGIVTRVVPAETLAAEADSLARTLADGPVQALAATRALLAESFRNGLADQLALEARTIAAAGRRAEAQEGLAAFLARRPPDFRAL